MVAFSRLSDDGKEEKKNRDEKRTGRPSLLRLFSSFPPSESLEQASEKVISGSDWAPACYG